MALITLNEIKDYLGIDPLNTDNDAYLNSEIVLFSNAIENYCNRKFEIDSYTETFYKEDFQLKKEYLLYHFPIVDVLNVVEKDNDGFSQNLTYRVNKRLGNLVNTVDGVSKYFFQNTGKDGFIDIIYTAGYATIPSEIKECISSLIQGRFNKKESGIDFNFGNNVQRVNIPGVMGIDFDYTLATNDRKNRFGMILGDWQNVLDFYVSERTLIGESNIKYLE